MAAPVWVLSVDLQTKTATFQSGMADAARSARSAFQDIGQSAQEGGRRASGGVMNVRASLGLLDNTIRGNHAAAMADLVHLFSQSQIVMAALPFAATVGGFLLLGGVILATVTKLREMKEAQAKLSREMTDFGTAAQNAFNSLDEKILEAGKKADELRNDHLGALSKELQLINRQSLDQLEHTFDDLAKRTDVVFDQLTSSWYTFGIGSDGARHALEVFKSQYDSLLSSGNGSGASGLLGGTLAAAEKVLAMQKQAQANSGTLTTAPGAGADMGASMRAQIELQKSGVGFTTNEIAAQETLVAALRDQQTIQEKIAALKKSESSNAGKETDNAASGRRSEAQRASAESMMRMGQQAIQADRAVAEAQLAARKASIAERLAVDTDFAGRERDVQLAANQAEISALDKSGKDYTNQLQAAKEKALEISQQYTTKITDLESKAATESAAKSVRDLEETIREKIAATTNGESQRLAVVDAALKTEQSRNLQDTAFYRELLTQKADITRTMAEEDAKRRETSGKQTAEDTQKSGELMLAAERASLALRNSTRRATDQQLIGQSLILAQQEYAIKQAALQQEAAALDKSGKDYQNKLKSIQDQEKQLVQQHENEVTQIKQKAEEAQNSQALSAWMKFSNAMSQGLTQSIMGHQTWGRMLSSIGDQVVSGMLQNAIKSMMTEDMGKEKEAAHAARQAFNIGLSIGGPAGVVLGPVFGAAAFASVMAFEGGGIVPGVGRGDIVPAMLTPGEGVIPKGIMDSLSSAARGGMDGGKHYHIHAPIHMAASVMDSDGVDRVFTKHSQQIQKHFEKALRRMNH